MTKQEFWDKYKLENKHRFGTICAMCDSLQEEVIELINVYPTTIVICKKCFLEGK